MAETMIMAEIWYKVRSMPIWLAGHLVGAPACGAIRFAIASYGPGL